MFHLLNSIGFAHVLPVSLALFSKIAPRQINATVIGLYYLAFFIANAVVGYVGGLYSSLPTTTFWLIHVASAGVGLVAFVLVQGRVRSADDDGNAASRLQHCPERDRDLANESKFQWMARFGFLVRGLLYIVIALLVIGAGRTEDLTGAMEYLHRGYGRWLLILMVVGMCGYSIWRVSDAAFGTG